MNTTITHAVVDARYVNVTAVLFEHEKDTVPKPWSGQLIDLLGEAHEPRESKPGTRCFSMVVYEDGAKRGSSGVKYQTAIVLDLDHITDDQLARAWHWLSGFAGAMYSSFSDRAANPNDRCARLIVLLSRWLYPGEAASVRDAVVQMLVVPADEHATDPARIWYVPACPAARRPGAFIAYTVAALLDPDMLLAAAHIVAFKKRQVAKSSADWRDLAANGVAEGQRNLAVTWLTGHLLRNGIDPFVTLELVLAWNRLKNTPPLPDDEVIVAVNSISGRELRRREGTRGR
jgi:hypothetical protein